MKKKDENSVNKSGFTSVLTEDPNSKIEDITENSLCKIAFFSSYRRENIFFKRCISLENFDCYPKNILHYRNALIVLNFIQTICGLIILFSIRLYEEDLFNFSVLCLITIFGIYGLASSIPIHIKRLNILHYLSIILSIVFITYHVCYSLIQHSKNLRDPSIKTLEFPVSFIYIFPILNGVIIRKLVKEFNEKVNIDEINKINLAKYELIAISSQFSQQYIKEIFEEVDEKICIICRKKERNTILLPCTHSLVCIHCLHIAYEFIIVKVYQPKCPECKREISCYYKKKPKQIDTSLSFLRFKSDYSLINLERNVEK